MSRLSHVDDYPEIPISTASTRTALLTGTWRSVRPVLAERTAPCTAACPAAISIPSYLHHVASGQLEAAFAAVTLRNPFPRITGRVCPHACETACNIAARGGPPLSIRAVERWLGDATAELPHVAPHAGTGHHIAVVGSGPAGLSAAYYGRRSGHAVTVFERREHPGGLLRYGIPEYRLPTSIVDEEIDRLAAMGVEFRCGVALGRDVTVDGLARDHAAIFVATGAATPGHLGISGESLLEPGLAFLAAAKQGDVRLPGPRCAVIGGGNTAMDVARLLRKLGADVTVLYRRTAAELPAIREEFEHAVADGVVFTWLTAPRTVAKEAGGLAVTVESMRLGPVDASGRRRPEPTGQMRILQFDAVFAAIGERPDTSPLPQLLEDEAGHLRLDESGATMDAQVFAGGDLATGPATVVAAIAAGRRAAQAIDTQLGFADRWPSDAPDDVVRAPEVNPVYVPRHPPPVERRSPWTDPRAEETTTLDAAAIQTEIQRCYSCGHCNECGACHVFCPDGAIGWDAGPVIDLDFCKGCGICVVECPGQALVLVNERELTSA